MKIKTIDSNEIDFLRESNAIEGIYNEDSLIQACEAWSYLKSKKCLTIHVILKTHLILMKNQNLEYEEKGIFRQCEVIIGGRYGLNWVKVPEAMKAWVKLINDTFKVYYHKSPRLIPEIQFHHVEYERIHPFVDGNGRTGRMFLNWERLRAGLPILVIKESERQDYYKWFK